MPQSPSQPYIAKEVSLHRKAPTIPVQGSTVERPPVAEAAGGIGGSKVLILGGLEPEVGFWARSKPVEVEVSAFGDRVKEFTAMAAKLVEVTGGKIVRAEELGTRSAS